MARLRIGALATCARTNAPTIRYYEEIGLLPRAERQSGGQRTYADEDVTRLNFIRRCREFGFSIDRVRALVELVQDRQRSCFHARDLANEHLTEVRSKLKEIRALERGIAKFVADCDSLCSGGAGPDCVVLQDLGRASKRKAQRTYPRE
jgi:DNA-binding transcriptional MerR regulator